VADVAGVGGGARSMPSRQVAVQRLRVLGVLDDGGAPVRAVAHPDQRLASDWRPSCAARPSRRRCGRGSDAPEVVAADVTGGDVGDGVPAVLMSMLWERAVEVWHTAMPVYRPVLIHRDFHPGNVLWARGRCTGIVDWPEACRGPAGCDVARCRSELIRLAGIGVADGCRAHIGRPPVCVERRSKLTWRPKTGSKRRSGRRRVLFRYDHVGPHSCASVDIDAEHPAARERLLDLLASRVLVEGVNGQLGFDLNEERPLLLWHGLGIPVWPGDGEPRTPIPEGSGTGGVASNAPKSRQPVIPDGPRTVRQRFIGTGRSAREPTAGCPGVIGRS